MKRTPKYTHTLHPKERKEINDLIKIMIGIAWILYKYPQIKDD